MRYRFSIAILITLFAATVCIAADEDPYLWLEEVESEKALEWAKERSDQDTAVIEAVPEFEDIHAELLEIYNSKDRIPTPAVRGAWIYNFWQDAEHVRGVWRRTFLSEFVKEKPAWETVLDLDALAEAEGENWVWSEVECLGPDHRRCMIGLSRGGADATVVREFDTVAKEFVDGGYKLDEAKHQIDWMDENTLWVASDFGEGSLTASGYARIAKSWKRGTALEEAATVFEGSVDDVFVFAFSDHTPEGRTDFVSVIPEFFRGTSYIKLGKPDDAQMRGVFKERMLVSLRNDWQIGDTTYPQDALLAIGLDDFLRGERDFDILFKPQERVSLDQVGSTRNHLIYTTLDNVHSRMYRLAPTEDGWATEELELPGIGSVRLDQRGTPGSFFSDSRDDFFFTYTDFVTPTSLYLMDREGTPKRIKTSPAWFDATGMSVVQNEAVSKDGTRIPYFVFMPPGFEADGVNPTVIYAYGGFEVSRLPRYSAADGAGWVARGGVYVLANIRGGGEFGPKWHQAAMQEKHQNNFDDLIAVAEDLIERKITSPQHLGIMGGSQGGLLVGGAFVQRPELFNAVACAVPLLDMKRYNKLLAGASWMAEYGNPDTDDWDYIKLWSPYQNLDKKADYPEVFFWTNTRDDRVHPAHARKMVARMTEQGHKVYYYENTEGGHSAGANLGARAYTDALEYAYLWMKLR
ncbi:MAG: prolyl oligopeptidase family serine peptidase [Acidobacteriota bacterium]|nr:prolyl oligopeptidase family serine peptidase [Acidobacteriota bacterium]